MARDRLKEARKDARKITRTLTRLKHSVAADREIRDRLETLDDEFDRVLTTGSDGNIVIDVNEILALDAGE